VPKRPGDQDFSGKSMIMCSSPGKMLDALIQIQMAWKCRFACMQALLKGSTGYIFDCWSDVLHAS